MWRYILVQRQVKWIILSKIRNNNHVYRIKLEQLADGAIKQCEHFGKMKIIIYMAVCKIWDVYYIDKLKNIIIGQLQTVRCMKYAIYVQLQFDI